MTNSSTLNRSIRSPGPSFDVDTCDETKRGLYSEKLLDDLHDRTTIQGVDELPDDGNRLCETPHDVPADQHHRVQAAFQEHVDNAVSKTVNLAQSISVGDVWDVFLGARELDLKGVTEFRSGARSEQVLTKSPRKEACVGECEYVSPRQQ